MGVLYESRSDSGTRRCQRDGYGRSVVYLSLVHMFSWLCFVELAQVWSFMRAAT